MSSSPRWVRDVVRFLPVKSQFVLSGNVRDYYPCEVAGPGTAAQPLPLTSYLSEQLRAVGYERFLEFDPVEGFGVIVPRGMDRQEAMEHFSQSCGLKFNEQGRALASLQLFFELLKRLSVSRVPTVLFADFASRYLLRPDLLSETENASFTRALVTGLRARQIPVGPQRDTLFNPLFWITDKEGDLPDWLVLGNPRLRSVVVPMPDAQERKSLAMALCQPLEGFREAPQTVRQAQADLLVEQSEGLQLVDLIGIADLCRREKLRLDQIAEGVRRYKLGVTEDPWAKLDREKIRHGEEIVRRRVKGQRPAVTKMMDIIKRAVMRMADASSGRLSSRPRGVAFLAGPTGTGKTELAKTITELLFGDDRAYIWFDMSEFAQEHSDQRLLGAPPGYVGYDTGGELTNAIRERPFSVVLFDEIEKAHPRILDKFLQILDDGVLTSGRGERVYFSEAVIIFTSNLGIYRTTQESRRELNVDPTAPYEELQRKVRAEIETYFKLELGRPEILNRIGENIVVFDFIREDVAEQIFQAMQSGIVAQVLERTGITVELSQAALGQLRLACLQDLSNGGRGIRNHLEAVFVNPLARQLFDDGYGSGDRVRVESVTGDARLAELTLAKLPPAG